MLTKENKPASGAWLWRGPVRHQVNAQGKMTAMWWIKCPKCGSAGMADRDQVEGRVSLICECGWRGYMANPLAPEQVEESIDSLLRKGRKKNG